MKNQKKRKTFPGWSPEHVTKNRLFIFVGKEGRVFKFRKEKALEEYGTKYISKEGCARDSLFSYSLEVMCSFMNRESSSKAKIQN